MSGDQGEAGRRPMASIVVPAFHEAENLPHLIERVAAMAGRHALSIEMLVMDDDSRDGSVEAVRDSGDPRVQIVVRAEDHGLSPAVLEGMRLARGEVLVCMDADLSHPPESVPALLAKLAEGADFVIGSRYAKGGTTSDDWGFFRWLNSRVATLLARPLTSVSDPMSGFFALRRETFEAGRQLNPIGYKIGLELIVKCGCERVVEVPIHFEDRRFGESKLTVRQQLLYLKHLRRLYLFKFGAWSALERFLAVGALGTAANLALLTALLAAHVSERPAVAAAIFGSMVFNFLLHRRLVRATGGPRPFALFVLASAAGALVNYAVTLLGMARFPQTLPQLDALAGIACGTAINLLASRYRVFRSRHIRPRRELK